jgi:glycosyltransferase involved in cell wall biosynthesis
MDFSIVIPCRNEAGFIAQCVESIANSECAKHDLEIIVVDGMSTDGTRDTVKEISRTHPFVKLVDNPKRNIPSALNVGFGSARGRWVIRMDAHATYDPDYVVACVRALEETKAAGVGGAMITRPRDSSLLGTALVQVISHPFGVGNSRFRTQPQAATYVDTIFSGCYRRDTVAALLPLDEAVVASEDMLLHHRLRATGGRLLLLPRPNSYYFARSDLKGFCRHTFRGGCWSVAPLWLRRSCYLSWRHLTPVLVLAAALALLVLSLVLTVAWWVLLTAAACYSCGAIAAGIHIAIRKRRFALGALAVPLFALFHLTYGAGGLWGIVGLCRGAWRSRQTGEATRSLERSELRTTSVDSCLPWG